MHSSLWLLQSPLLHVCGHLLCRCPAAFHIPFSTQLFNLGGQEFPAGDAEERLQLMQQRQQLPTLYSVESTDCVSWSRPGKRSDNDPQNAARVIRDSGGNIQAVPSTIMPRRKRRKSVSPQLEVTEVSHDNRLVPAASDQPRSSQSSKPATTTAEPIVQSGIIAADNVQQASRRRTTNKRRNRDDDDDDEGEQQDYIDSDEDDSDEDTGSDIGAADEDSEDHDSNRGDIGKCPSYSCIL